VSEGSWELRQWVASSVLSASLAAGRQYNCDSPAAVQSYGRVSPVGRARKVAHRRSARALGPPPSRAVDTTSPLWLTCTLQHPVRAPTPHGAADTHSAGTRTGTRRQSQQPRRGRGPGRGS